MEYTKDTMPDGTVYERYEGTPGEIAELIGKIPHPIEIKVELDGKKISEQVIDNIQKDYISKQ